MQLRIRNIGKVEDAELNLNGITVVAGNNNTGKSTIGKTIFALFNSLAHIEERIDNQTENLLYNMLCRKMEDFLSVKDERYSLSRIPPSFIRQRAKTLQKLMTENDQQNQKKVIESFFRLLKKGNVDETVVQNVLEEIGRIKALPKERLIRTAVTSYFGQIYYSEINSIYQTETEAIVELELNENEVYLSFQENNCVEFRQKKPIWNEAVYLDNPFVLDYVNEEILGLNAIEKNTVAKLRISTDISENIVQSSLVKVQLQEVLEKISKVSAGSMLSDETGSYYYKEKKAGKPLNVNNLSAGLKTFVIVKRLLENGSLKENDVLILDEPEIHLHPAWQLLYAEVIVLLHKTFGLTIVLTTHSADFLEALQYYVKKYSLEDKTTYYLAENGQNGCGFKDVTKDTTEIYSQLVKPGILLERLKFEMEDAENDEF